MKLFRINKIFLICGLILLIFSGIAMARKVYIWQCTKCHAAVRSFLMPDLYGCEADKETNKHWWTKR
jgi:hypothetical protein